MAIIVNGKKIASQILERVAQKVQTLKKRKTCPKLGIILVGQDKASKIYVEKKIQACLRVGLNFILKKYSSKISTEKLIKEIEIIQKKEKLSALIIQLPLPKQIDSYQVLNQIRPEIDIDYLSERSLGKLISGHYQLEPPTLGAILEILKHYKIKLDGKRIVLVGVGPLVGRPLFNLLLFKKATITVCHSRTKNLKDIVRQADILISGVGKRNLIRGSMLKKNVAIIDAGISFYRRKVYSDVNFAEAIKKASLITPTPGGVGPITVAKLIESVVENTASLWKKDNK